LLVALAALLLVLAIGHAWVAEDAFITFRVVDNAVNGLGLRWNPDERVEVYTNPLWMLIHIPIHALYRNIFLTTMLVGLITSILAVLVAARARRAPAEVTALALLLPLVLSKSFLEFSTSGLENPLSHLMAALFFATLVRHRSPDESPPWFRLSLFAAVAGFNRLDTLLLFVPAMAWLLVTRRREVRWAPLLAGLVPLVAWKVFALWYYGFPVPNTAYAKLDTGVDRMSYVRQGLWYGADLVRRDLPTFLVIAAGTVVVLAVLFAARRGARRADPADRAAAWFGVGAIVYAGYVIGIGGDFMAGRFWSLPFFGMAMVLYALVPRPVPATRLAYAAAVLVLAKAITLQTEPPETVGDHRIQRTWRNIDDERLKYADHAAFFWRRPDRIRLSLPEQAVGADVILWYAVGLNAYRAGSRTVVVDGLGLADPLLARLPPLSGRPFYVGHFMRGIPQDYLVARAVRTSEPLSPTLRAYYDKLRLITSGSLVDPERLATLVRFNLGGYDDLRAAYLASGEPRDMLEKGTALTRGPPPGVETAFPAGDAPGRP
jgi:arabinofuranosyltransferase